MKWKKEKRLIELSKSIGFPCDITKESGSAEFADFMDSLYDHITIYYKHMKFISLKHTNTFDYQTKEFYTYQIQGHRPSRQYKYKVSVMVNCLIELLELITKYKINKNKLS
jgi:hypothetical protein